MVTPTNILTPNERHFILQMDHLAAWYAGHKFGSAVQTVSLPEEGDEMWDGTIISLVWGVYDEFGDELGVVTWSIDGDADGWTYENYQVCPYDDPRSPSCAW